MIRLPLILLVALPVAGCASTPSSTNPYANADAASVVRDTATAERLTREAAELIETDPERAETLLREALTADLYHGPAHNNLGVLYLNAGRLYEAAGEFEWARKSMPGHPEPRMNLAMTLERAGRFNEALAAYDAALEAYPEHLGSMQGKARLQVRHGLVDESTPALLDSIAMRGDDDWRGWAIQQSLRMEEDR